MPALHGNAAGAGGLGATSGFIADLLVEDLDKGGATLRKQIPSLLAELVADGHVMQIGDKYALQTEEGADQDEAQEQNGAVGHRAQVFGGDHSMLTP